MGYPVRSFFIAFHVESADLIDPAGEPITLFTLPANDRCVRVPSHLELYVANTDTAYTISDAPATQGASYQDNYVPSTANYADGFSGGRLLYVVEDEGRILFYTPMVGLFDSLDVKKKIVMANSNGATFRSGQNTFRLRMGASLSAGDGDLYGRLHFDEYALYA